MRRAIPVANTYGRRGPTGPGSDITSAEIDAARDAAVAAAAEAAASAAAAVAAVIDRVTSATVTGGTYTCDLSAYDVFVLTLTGDASLAVTGLVPGRSFVVKIIQDDSGGHTLTLPYALGPVFTLSETANTYERLVYSSDDGARLDVVKAAGPVTVPVPWTPNSMANQISRINAAAIAGDSGDSVTTWANQWGEADLTAPGVAPTLQIINGVPVVRFDAVAGSYMQATLNASHPQPITVGFVGRSTATGNIKSFLFDTVSSGSLGIYVLSGAGGAWTLNAGSSLTGVADDLQWTTVVAVINGASSKLRIDGVEVTGNAGANVLDAIRIGMNASGSSKGSLELAEQFIVGHVSDVTEIGKIENYLNEKRSALAGS